MYWLFISTWQIDVKLFANNFLCLSTFNGWFLVGSPCPWSFVTVEKPHTTLENHWSMIDWFIVTGLWRLEDAFPNPLGFSVYLQTAWSELSKPQWSQELRHKIQKLYFNCVIIPFLQLVLMLNSMAMHLPCNTELLSSLKTPRFSPLPWSGHLLWDLVPRNKILHPATFSGVQQRCAHDMLLTVLQPYNPHLFQCHVDFGSLPQSLLCSPLPYYSIGKAWAKKGKCSEMGSWTTHNPSVRIVF